MLQTIRQSIPQLSHYPLSAGHHQPQSMYFTIRQTFYWPRRVFEVYAAADYYSTCGENITFYISGHPLQLHSASTQLEFAVANIFGPFHATLSTILFVVLSPSNSSKSRCRF